MVICGLISIKFSVLTVKRNWKQWCNQDFFKTKTLKFFQYQDLVFKTKTKTLHLETKMMYTRRRPKGIFHFQLQTKMKMVTISVILHEEVCWLFCKTKTKTKMPTKMKFHLRPKTKWKRK